MPQSALDTRRVGMRALPPSSPGFSATEYPARCPPSHVIGSPQRSMHPGHSQGASTCQKLCSLPLRLPRGPAPLRELSFSLRARAAGSEDILFHLVATCYSCENFSAVVLVSCCASLRGSCAALLPPGVTPATPVSLDTSVFAFRLSTDTNLRPPMTTNCIRPFCAHRHRVERLIPMARQNSDWL